MSVPTDETKVGFMDSWTLSSLKVYLDSKIDMIANLISVMSTSVDQRFLDADKAVNAALVAQEKAVAAALAASEKAVIKAEVSTEKRFDEVAVLRNQISDQATSFMSRTEADIRITGINEKVDSETKRTTQRLNDLELRLTSRLDLGQGEKQGTKATLTAAYYGISAVLIVISIVVTVLLLKH